MTVRRRIPVLVVGGFLGSGKTTLVRHLLAAAQAEGARVAFISNELGELGIDEALLGGGREDWVEIAGGCVCCQLDDELFQTLIKLRAEVDPDRIVIECSGAAVPHDVQLALYQDPVRGWVSEEAVVVVVDAEQLLHGRDADETFVEQVETADIVLLHKVDLVEAAALPGLEGRIDALNPGVPVVRASHGQVDPRLLLAAQVRDPGSDPRPTGPHDGHDHGHLHADFVTQVVDVPAGQTADAVLAHFDAAGALRIKGFVQLDSGLSVVQGVGRRVELAPFDGAVPAALIGKVVVIRQHVGAAG